jgi:hypothetical protein
MIMRTVPKPMDNKGKRIHQELRGLLEAAAVGEAGCRQGRRRQGEETLQRDGHCGEEGVGGVVTDA